MHESPSYLSDECIHIKKNSEISNIYVLFNFPNWWTKIRLKVANIEVLRKKLFNIHSNWTTQIGCIRAAGCARVNLLSILIFTVFKEIKYLKASADKCVEENEISRWWVHCEWSEGGCSKGSEQPWQRNGRLVWLWTCGEHEEKDCRTREVGTGEIRLER